MSVKRIAKINHGLSKHWVGDGFPVSTLFSYDEEGNNISPFLLLDHAGPYEFPPASTPRGVGQHPHRGFETVTIVYDGEVEHQDTAGNAGKIGPGDVQWMTAAQGILHEEHHGRDFTQKGGTLEMVQLWVNLPAKDKMTVPRYQGITNQDIPVVQLPDAAGSENAGLVRVIAGEYAGITGPAKTFTPINLWDMRLQTGQSLELNLTDGYTTALLVLKGDILINGEQTVQAAELALFERQGQQVTLKAESDAVLLVMNGEPIDEPIAGYGPFVMNTQGEIRQAMSDLRAGRF